MSEVQPEDPKLDVVRALLKEDDIKLWLPPYTNEETNEGHFPPELVEKISKGINLPPNEVIARLEYLRQNALERLTAQSVFKETGVATFKVKVGGKRRSDDDRPKTFNVNLSLSETGRALRQKVIEGLHTAPSTSSASSSSVRVICRGKVINDEDPIQAQGLRNGAVLMVLVSVGEEGISQEEKKQIGVRQVTRAAEILSSVNDFDDLDLQASNLSITDQNGKPLNLPHQEKKSLIQGMALNDKAKQFLKRRDYELALPLLIEADRCFSRCSEGILKRVDNYALLHLDVAWCYLCLSNIGDLPDAEQRLEKCEECFLQSYGRDLSRAANLKGEVLTTKVLIGRLHLLQGILAFHRGKLHRSKELLASAEEELNSLIVTPDLIGKLLMMGFSEQEARLGLRACSNNENAAIDWIMRRREERKKTRDNEKRRKRIGKTISGKDVNISMLDQLLEMGFPEQLAEAALRQTDNSLIQAIHLIETEPELLIESTATNDPTEHESGPDYEVTDEMVHQVSALGFDWDQALSVLNDCRGNVERAVQVLLGNASPPSTSSSSSSSSPPSSTNEAPLRRKKKKKKISEDERDALNDLVNDLEFDDDKIDDHLDLALDEEMEFLGKYKSLF